MAHSTVFGYEQEDGSVHSILCAHQLLDTIYVFLEARTTPPPEKTSRYISSEQFFNQENFKADVSIWRVLYKLDNTVVIRHTTSKTCELVLRPLCQH
jgi:hypothetical protein